MIGLLRDAVDRGASDLHVVVGVPPVFRVCGQLVHGEYGVLTAEDSERLFLEIATDKECKHFENYRECDFAFFLAKVSRFRVNVFQQRGSIAIAVRIIPNKVPPLEELGFPSVIKKLSRQARGLVLVTGPTGSGKSTSLAAMIRNINEERSCYILTLEDPIEYLHEHGKSIISQREIHADTESFAIGLRAALREDPDVILVGEMRDYETMATAITAAETGHLVFATLHTGCAAQTIDRIIDSFPANQQQQIRLQLSLTLQGIISQQLLPRVDRKGRVAALEILLSTPAVRNLIRDGKTPQVGSCLQSGIGIGMQSMDVALKNLYKKGIISYEDALSRAIDGDCFVRLVNGNYN